jgi:hypothetical protein
MKIGRETWRGLPVIARGLIVAFAVIVILGTAVGSLLGRYRKELKGLDDEAPTTAAYMVWLLAALAFAVVVFRRGGRRQ